MATDIYLDPDSHDVVMFEGSPRMTANDSEDAAQRLKVRLLIFQAEWLLDTREGVPYFQTILEKTSKAAIDAIFKAKIKEEPLVSKIISFTSALNSNRVYDLKFEVLLVTGETLQDTINIGV